MKKKFRYIFASALSICLITIFCFLVVKKAIGQDAAKNQLVTVREYIGYAGCNIVIAYGDNKTETIELENGFKPKKWAENTDKINYVLNKLINSGYTIITSNGSGGGQAPFMINTYILKKN
jgi:hypothetical protein